MLQQIETYCFRDDRNPFGWMAWLLRALTTVWSCLAVTGCASSRAQPGPLIAQEPRSGFRLHETCRGNQTVRYLVYVPPNYDPTHRWPCVVFLHGAGECGSDPERTTAVGLGPALRANPERWPCLVAFPQKPSSQSEWEEHEALVLGVLEAVQQHYSVDPRRISLTGLSQGGHGTWMIGARHPEIWSCLVPVCGYGQPSTTAPRVAHLPIWAFHGQEDSVVAVDQTRRIVEAIKTLQNQTSEVVFPARMTIYPGVNHNSWEKAYADAELAEWMLAQQKKPGIEGTP